MIRTVRKTVMLSEGEFEAMKVAAAAEGQTVPGWLRTLGLRAVNNPPPEHETRLRLF